MLPDFYEYTKIPGECLGKAFVACGKMPYIADNRPYLTLARYIEMWHGTLQMNQDGGLVLTHPHKQETVSLPQLLQRVRESISTLRKTAKTCYERMCLDEDEEEMQLLLDAYRRCSAKKKKAVMDAEQSMTEDDSVQEVSLMTESNSTNIKKGHHEAPFWVLY